MSKTSNTRTPEMTAIYASHDILESSTISVENLKSEIDRQLVLGKSKDDVMRMIFDLKMMKLSEIDTYLKKEKIVFSELKGWRQLTVDAFFENRETSREDLTKIYAEQTDLKDPKKYVDYFYDMIFQLSTLDIVLHKAAGSQTEDVQVPDGLKSD